LGISDGGLGRICPKPFPVRNYSAPACNSNTLSPVIWENGTIYDLSALIVPSPGVTLSDVASLNDGGEISGLATLPNGDLHAVLLIPCDAEHENVDGCDYKLVDAAAASSKPTAFTQSTPSEAMRARFAHWHHQPSFGPNN